MDEPDRAGRNCAVEHCDSGRPRRAKQHPAQVATWRIGRASGLDFRVDESKSGVTVNEASSAGVVLSVRDEGIGIRPDELDGLFQPFHGSFAKGSGLGLAIVHRIVTDYNGEIQVSSQPGSGTTVSVRLPARAAVAT